MTLAGLPEIAAEFGVSRKAAWEWSKHPDFPAPVAELDMGRVWDLDAVREWRAAKSPAR